MAARYRSGYLVPGARGALSHAEALATGNAFTWIIANSSEPVALNWRIIDAQDPIYDRRLR
jgi:hypothetical protein